MHVSIIVVNYRTASLALDCLKSIHSEVLNELPITVFVVDNHSCDNSVEVLSREILERGWNGWVSFLPLEKNGGFAFGNNRALEEIFSRPVPPDFFWLLNPDTVVKAGACKALVDFLGAHPEVGIAGSRLVNLDGEHQISAFKDNTVISELLAGARLGILDKLFSKWLVTDSMGSERAHTTDWVSGASMMVRRKVFEDIGFLDENYFMYFEEVDFCMRARKAGWGVWYVPQSRVVHLEGASAVGIDPRARRRSNFWFESRRRFLLKNYGPRSLLLSDLAWVVGYSTWRFRRIVQQKPDSDPHHYLSSFLRNSFVGKGFKFTA